MKTMPTGAWHDRGTTSISDELSERLLATAIVVLALLVWLSLLLLSPFVQAPRMSGAADDLVRVEAVPQVH